LRRRRRHTEECERAFAQACRRRRSRNRDDTTSGHSALRPMPARALAPAPPGLTSTSATGTGTEYTRACNKVRVPWWPVAGCGSVAHPPPPSRGVCTKERLVQNTHVNTTRYAYLDDPSPVAARWPTPHPRAACAQRSARRSSPTRAAPPTPARAHVYVQ
jgi:hypothetical protein